MTHHARPVYSVSIRRTILHVGMAAGLWMLTAGLGLARAQVLLATNLTSALRQVLTKGNP